MIDYETEFWAFIGFIFLSLIKVVYPQFVNYKLLILSVFLKSW